MSLNAKLQPDTAAATVPIGLHPEVEALLIQAAAVGSPRITSLPLDVMRQAASESVSHVDAAPERVASVQDLDVPAGKDTVTGRLYHPEGSSSDAILLYCHGGGWVPGGLDTHDAFCRFACNRLHIRVLSLDYRRAPEHPFPAAYDDALAAARWLASSPAACGVAISGIILGGDSAGGNLAAAVAATLIMEPDVQLLGQLLLYPVLDICNRTRSYDTFATGLILESEDMAYFIAQYVPDASVRGDGRVSPLLLPVLAAPPTVIVTAGCDVLRDEGRAYAARLSEAGVETHFHEAAGLTHGFATMRRALPSSDAIILRAFSDLGEILASRRLSNARSGAAYEHARSG